MPGIVMHHHLGHVIYSGFEEKMMDAINQDLFDLGLAGPDIYSKIRYFNRKKNSGYQDLSYILHTQDTKKYFLTLCDEVEKNKELFGYLCGQVAHYYLDVFINPYIYYSCGYYSPSIDNSLKYRGKKMVLEQAMDASLIEKVYDSKPTKFDIEKNCFRIEHLDSEYREIFDDLFLKAYHLKGGYKLVNDGIRYQKKFLKKTYDPSGFKGRIFRIIDNGKSKTIYKYITFRKKTIDEKQYDFMNARHGLWINPIDSEIRSNASVDELFESAKQAATKCFDELYRYFFEEAQINLDYLFSDLSYITGLPCDKGCEIVNMANTYGKN